MSTPIVTKVTSLGSQHSDAGAPSVPNPTPATEALRRGDVDPPPSVDLMAVSQILVPIQEELNDSADEASYPSPPINTPEAVSPAASVVQQTHFRGLSVIGDRLAELKISYKFPLSDTDGTSSNSSFGASAAEVGEPASVGDVLSDDGSKVSVPIMLGSPAANPRIGEYLAFKTDDLSPLAPTPLLPSALLEDSASSTKTFINEDGMDSITGGVKEKSTWAEEVEDQLNRACQCLEQLAQDEHEIDPSKSVEEYYIARLGRLLGSGKRGVPVSIEMQVTKVHE